MRIRRLGLLTVALTVVACSFSDDTALAEAEVSRFHDALDSRQFAALYENAGAELKAVSTESDFVALLGAVHRKLGDVSASNKVSWHVNYHTSGTFVTLGYDTMFTNGKGSEQFVYKLEDDRAVLVGYNIHSNDLITN